MRKNQKEKEIDTILYVINDMDRDKRYDKKRGTTEEILCIVLSYLV